MYCIDILDITTRLLVNNLHICYWILTYTETAVILMTYESLLKYKKAIGALSEYKLLVFFSPKGRSQNSEVYKQAQLKHNCIKCLGRKLIQAKDR